jgi:hypothetical protein
MITLEQTWHLIESINNRAHERSQEYWTEADELDESEDEADWCQADAMREEAKMYQSSYFRDGYHELTLEQQQNIQHWIQHDADFRKQFEIYFGEEDFSYNFTTADDSDGGHLD